MISLFSRSAGCRRHVCGTLLLRKRSMISDGTSRLLVLSSEQIRKQDLFGSTKIGLPQVSSSNVHIEDKVVLPSQIVTPAVLQAE